MKQSESLRWFSELDFKVPENWNVTTGTWTTGDPIKTLKELFSLIERHKSIHLIEVFTIVPGVLSSYFDTLTRIFVLVTYCNGTYSLYDSMSIHIIDLYQEQDVRGFLVGMQYYNWETWLGRMVR